MDKLRVPSNWTGEARSLVRQLEEESTASETRINSKINSKIGAWKAWVPTLTWAAGTPSPVTKTGRYCIIGDALFFNIYITSTDGNGATGLAISLPVTPVENCSVSAQQGVTTTWTSPIAFVNSATTEINFRAGSVSTCTNGATCYFRITGQYEI